MIINIFYSKLYIIHILNQTPPIRSIDQQFFRLNNFPIRPIRQTQLAHETKSNNTRKIIIHRHDLARRCRRNQRSLFSSSLNYIIIEIVVTALFSFAGSFSTPTDRLLCHTRQIVVVVDLHPLNSTNQVASQCKDYTQCLTLTTCNVSL